jgi:predicted ATPase
VAAVEDIVSAIAYALNTRFETEDHLLRVLQDKVLLLVLDNFEHLRDGAALMARILEAAPAIKILVTSQASLNLQGEWVRYLDGLDFPPNVQAADAEQYSAVQLFAARVRRVRGDFDLTGQYDCVLKICQLVDGVPLAIELAAAWLKTLTCADVLREIQRNIDFLATRQPDVEERHRSIRALFDYAWNLLTPEEQRAFRRLSVFRGGFGLTAAEQVAGASLPVLASLVDKSLLHQNTAGLYEFHDMLRQYAQVHFENTDAQKRSMRSNILVGWAALIKGNFDRVKEIAERTLELTSDSDNGPDQAFGMSVLGLLAGIDEDYTRCMQLLEASQPLMGKDPLTRIFHHLGLAVGYCGLEDYPAARRAAQAALRFSTLLHSPAFLTLCLPVMTIILAYEVETERAGELMALAATHPASTPDWMEHWPVLVCLRDDLEAELGQAEFDAAWARGTALKLDAVVADLLAE